MIGRSTTLVSEPFAIGSILLSMGVITRDQLREAVRVKDVSQQDIYLGHTLIALSFITKDDLDHALKIQESAKNGDLSQANLLTLEYQQKRFSDAVDRAHCVVDELDATLDDDFDGLLFHR